MKFTTNNIEILKSPLGVMLVIPAPHDNDLSKLKKDTEYTIEIKRKQKRRSLTANSFAWVVCQKIAEHLSKDGQYFSREDVYKKALRDCGRFTPTPVRNDAVERYIEIWEGHGIGWIAEVDGPCKNTQGYTMVKAYHGSSVYTVEEMSRLIDCLVDECNQLGIKLDDSDYIKSLVEEWGNEQS